MYKSKNELHIASKEIHFKYKDKNRTKLTRWKIIQHGNTNQRKSGQTLLISNKVDFRAKNITRGKESYFIVIKGSIHQEDTVILNIYAFNNRALKYLNKTDRTERGNRQIQNYSWNFNTPHSIIIRTNRKSASIQKS